MSLWWLVFCDRSRPEGESILGAAFVEGADEHAAIQAAWRIRPEVAQPTSTIPKPIHPDAEKHIGPEWRGRLLTQEECVQIDRQVMRKVTS